MTMLDTMILKTKILKINFIKEIIFLTLVVISFIYFYFLPVLYTKDFFFKISTVSFKSTDKNSDFFEISPFEVAKIFNTITRYKLASSEISARYLLKYDNFRTRGLNEENSLTISLETSKIIPSIDIEKIAQQIKNDLLDTILIQLKKSDPSIEPKGDFFIISITEIDNTNLKKKAPFFSSILLLFFYILIHPKFVRLITDE